MENPENGNLAGLIGTPDQNSASIEFTAAKLELAGLTLLRVRQQAEEMLSELYKNWIWDEER